MEGRESMGLMMSNIMTADLMWRTMSILTQRGRNLMSIGTDIRVIVCRMMKTKEQDLLLPKWRRHIMLKNIQIMWTDRMKEIERQGTMTGRRSARYSYNSVTILVALLVCLAPTTIGALLSAIGIAGMSRLNRQMFWP